MHLFVKFDWFFIFQSFGNTHVASLRWICYQQILGASTDGTGSQNLLECSYKPLLSIHICIGRNARVTYRVPISLDSISFLATADCGVSTLGYSLSYVYATHHILKRLYGSGFCMRYLGWFGEKVLQVSQFPLGHVYGLQIPSSTWKCKRAHYCFFFLLSKTKQQRQEKPNCLGCKNNAMLLPTRHQNMFSSYLYPKVKEHFQAPWHRDFPHTSLAYVYSAMGMNDWIWT